jgi:hypothetical protein
MEANPKGAFRQEKEEGRLGRRAACVFDSSIVSLHLTQLTPYLSPLAQLRGSPSPSLRAPEPWWTRIRRSQRPTRAFSLEQLIEKES